MKTHRLRSICIPVICLIAGVMSIGIVQAGQDEEPFITIYPVSEHSIGDLVIISGTTNLDENTELFIQVLDVHYNTGTKVLKGTKGINRWSVPIDTTGIKPGDYRVKVTERKGFNVEKNAIIFGNTTNTTRLVLTGIYLGADIPVPAENQSHAFITVDPIKNRNKGEQFLVTGTTNLSVGTDIVWVVKPSNLEEMTTGDATGSMGNSQVTKGSENNRISYALDTVYLIPGEYNVTASTIIGEIFSDDMEMGPVSDSAIFTIK